MGLSVRSVIFASLALLFTFFTAPARAAATDYGYGNHHSPRTYTVKSGQKIQHALNKATYGDRIIVERGEYKENLVIKTSGISLIGKGARLVPPTSFIPNVCTNLAPNDQKPTLVTQAGICIHGKDVKLAKYEREHRKFISAKELVRGVLITGFDITGFSGLNIAVVGAKDTNIFENRLSDGGQYGALTLGSKNTRIHKNKVLSKKALLFIGICMDDQSDVHVTSNTIFGYGIGLCVQTKAAEVKKNNVSGGCIGAFIDPGIVGAKVQDNYFHAPNPVCLTNEFQGSFGIIIAGAKKSEVKFNRINGYLYGIGVFDQTAPQPVFIAENNQVRENKISKSGASDFLVLSTGTGNVFKKNKCKTPAEICNFQ